MSTELSEEQRLMRQSCRDFVDDVIIPFIRGNWQREWSMTPEDRLPPEILQGAEKVGIRTLGVPEEFGGIELDRASEVQTFALIAEEIARGDSGLADKLVQNWKVSVLLRNLAPRHLQGEHHVGEAARRDAEHRLHQPGGRHLLAKARQDCRVRPERDHREVVPGQFRREGTDGGRRRP